MPVKKERKEVGNTNKAAASASAASLSTSGKQKKELKELRISLSQKNNMWHSGEHGEGRDSFTTGTIRPPREKGDDRNPIPNARFDTSQKVGSLSRYNNSWYTPEDGESRHSFTFGKIQPINERTHVDERYTYINECNDTIHRDYTLRFSLPDQSKKKKESYTVLPDMTFAHGSAVLPRAVRKQLVKAGKLDNTGNTAFVREALAVKAREGHVKPSNAASRFVAYSPAVGTSLPPI